MLCTPKTPSKSLSPALLKVKPGREQFEQFKEKLSGLVEQINSSPNESEEHHKNHVSDFLKYAFNPNCLLGQKITVGARFIERWKLNRAMNCAPTRGLGANGQSGFKFPAYFINTNDRIDLVIHNGKLTSQVLHAKASNAQADTASFENQLDNLFYALYGLTPGEIALVEGDASQVLAALEVVDGGSE